MPENEILDQFSGRKAGDRIDWRVKKDGGEFKFRTGATVTSRAVTEMTGKTAKTFAAHRAEAKGVSREQYLKRERIWAVVCVIILIVALAWATYYNLEIRTVLK